MSESSEKSVTLCVPCYNNGGTISETLKSLLNQSHSNTLIKVYDNHSSDESLSWIRKLSDSHKKIEVIESEETISAEDNFSRCIDGAEGDFTGIFHSDDVYNSNIINSQIKVFESDPEIGVVFTHARMINLTQKDLGVRFIPKELQTNQVSVLDFKKIFELVLKYGNFLTCPSALVRTEIYRNEIKVWNGKDFKSSADLDVWLRIAQNHKIAFIAKPLIDYRVSNFSFTHSLTRKRTDRHDFFLVTDRYLANRSTPLNQRDSRNHMFLKFKDNALRSLNIMKSGVSKPFPTDDLNYKNILLAGIQSRFHIKFLFYGLCINCIKVIYKVTSGMFR